MPISQWEGAKVAWCVESVGRTVPEPLPSTTAICLMPWAAPWESVV